MSNTKQSKQGPMLSNSTLSFLDTLVAQGRGTRKSLGLPLHQVQRLIDTESIVAAGFEKVTNDEGKPTKGRPRIVYKATSKGRDRVRRYRARLEREASQAEAQVAA